MRFFTLFMVAFAALGQSPPSPAPSFEVASIRVHQGRGRIGVTTSGNRLTARPALAGSLIMYAYDVKSYQLDDSLSRSPVAEIFYDILAKAEGDRVPTQAEFRAMLRQLLADRFNLKLHREPREMPVFALTVAKNGPKLKPGAPDAPPARFLAAGRNWRWIAPRATIAELVAELNHNAFLERPAFDSTGLAGTYNIELTYTPATPPNKRDPEPDDLSILTALEDQLGLKLEPGKRSIEVLVIDHIEKPTEN
ncbi:MAG TPA: TIGR03435 family protein [Bryobacteraceae bacterium]|nr:TIGR03435 family protein [Bryobacteraceae bacterium]